MVLPLMGLLAASASTALAQTSGDSTQPVTICNRPAVVPGQPEPPVTCVPGTQSGSTIQPATPTATPAPPTAARSLALTG
jgi:hypothetical protein